MEESTKLGKAEDLQATLSTTAATLRARGRRGGGSRVTPSQTHKGEVHRNIPKKTHGAKTLGLFSWLDFSTAARVPMPKQKVAFFEQINPSCREVISYFEVYCQPSRVAGGVVISPFKVAASKRAG